MSESIKRCHKRREKLLKSRVECGEVSYCELDWFSLPLTTPTLPKSASPNAYDPTAYSSKRYAPSLMHTAANPFLDLLRPPNIFSMAASVVKNLFPLARTTSTATAKIFPDSSPHVSGRRGFRATNLVGPERDRVECQEWHCVGHLATILRSESEADY